MHLAGKGLVSLNPQQARLKVRSLYRTTLREIPRIIRLYRLHYTVPQLRHKARRSFEDNKNVTDVSLIDSLVMAGANDLQEATENFMTKSHVMRWIMSVPDDDLTSRFDLESITNPQDRELVSRFLPTNPRGYDSFRRHAVQEGSIQQQGSSPKSRLPDM